MSGQAMFDQAVKAAECVRLTTQMLEAREMAQRILRSHYCQAMAARQSLLQQVMSTEQVNEIQAVIRLCQLPGVSATERCMLLAAAVELIEPSEGGCCA